MRGSLGYEIPYYILTRARSKNECIDTRISFEKVVATSANDHISARPADESVVANQANIVADEEVVTLFAKKLIITRATKETGSVTAIVAKSTKYYVIILLALKIVPARTAIEDIVTFKTLEDIIAGKSDDDVVAGKAGKAEVVPVRPDDRGHSRFPSQGDQNSVCAANTCT